MLEYRLMCMSKPDDISEPIIEHIEAYARYVDLESAWQKALEILVRSGACFVPVSVQ